MLTDTTFAQDKLSEILGLPLARDADMANPPSQPGTLADQQKHANHLIR